MSATINVHPPRILESSPFVICEAVGALDQNDHDLSILSNVEREQYVSIDPRRRPHWMLGRFAAKQAVRELLKAKHTEVAPQSIIITSRRGEAPKCHIERSALLNVDPLDPTPEVHISISHTGHTAVAAAADPENYKGVGVDIEELRTFDAVTARGFLTPREYDAYRACVGDDKRFLGTLLWSLKESYLKAIQTGLRTNPRRISVRFLEEKGRATFTYDDKETNARAIWTRWGDEYILVHVLV